MCADTTVNRLAYFIFRNGGIPRNTKLASFNMTLSLGPPPSLSVMAKVADSHTWYLKGALFGSKKLLWTLRGALLREHLQIRAQLRPFQLELQRLSYKQVKVKV